MRYVPYFMCLSSNDKHINALLKRLANVYGKRWSHVLCKTIRDLISEGSFIITNTGSYGPWLAGIHTY